MCVDLLDVLTALCVMAANKTKVAQPEELQRDLAVLTRKLGMEKEGRRQDLDHSFTSLDVAEEENDALKKRIQALELRLCASELKFKEVALR